MNEGDAKSWKAQFLRNAISDTGLDLGTWRDFITKVQDAFAPYDTPGDVLEEITNLKMGNTPIDDHIARYQILLDRSGVPRDSPSAIDYFRRTLNIPLQRKLLDLPTPPKNLKEWYEWAARLDNNFRKMQRILGRTSNGKQPEKAREEPRKRWNFQKKDPNAMDVDALTAEKRTEYMKKGLCFNCGKSGHLSKDCGEKKKPPSYAPTWTLAASSSTPIPPKKMSLKELYAHVRSITDQMDEKEKEAFYEEAEKEGF